MNIDSALEYNPAGGETKNVTEIRGTRPLQYLDSK